MTDLLFQNSLQDLIKGIRSHESDPSTYISKAITDIKTELRHTDAYTKTEAVRKLVYLQMIGYNISWASFSIVEVMSLPRFGHRRIGYLAANQSFNDSTDVILLTTNLFKKEFSTIVPGGSGTTYEIGSALNCLANIATKELAHDCLTDVCQLLKHASPYVRKKAILTLYKLYLKFPSGLRLTFDLLKEKLTDSDPGVVSTAVHVICELAHINPKNFLLLVPQFFEFLTTTSNNWMLIKVVKLFGALVAQEPRLARKLLDPLCHIINNTTAKSLQYECIYTLILAFPYTKRENGQEPKNLINVINLCCEHLKSMLKETDQNLKYLSLVGFYNLMLFNPKVVAQYRENFLSCLNDEDILIRRKALDILSGIITKKFLMNFISHLIINIKQLEGNNYRQDFVEKLLLVCKRDKYVMITDFIWYFKILIDLIKYTDRNQAKEIADQLIEITLRVEILRPYAVEVSLKLLCDSEELEHGQAKESLTEVLRASVWILGEYSNILGFISNDRDTEEVSSNSLEENSNSINRKSKEYWIEIENGNEIRSIWRGKKVFSLVLFNILHPKTLRLLPSIISTYLHAALKIIIQASNYCYINELVNIVCLVRLNIGQYLEHYDIEVKEYSYLLKFLLVKFNIINNNLNIHIRDNTNTPLELNISNIFFNNSSPLSLLFTPNMEDYNGAKELLKKREILNTLTYERFFFVHPKAQEQVSPPDVDLDKLFNKEMVKKLSNIQVKFVPNITNISLFGSTIIDNSNINNNNNNIPPATVPISASISSSTSTTSSISPYVSSTPLIPTKASVQNDGYHNSKNEIFILSNSKKKKEKEKDISTSLSSPSTILLHNEKRKTKKKKITIDLTEVLPESSSNIIQTSMTSNSTKRKKKVNSEELGLGEIDILTPLREDEFIPQPTHRVVSYSAPVPPSLTNPSFSSNQIEEDSIFTTVKKEKRRKVKTEAHVAEAELNEKKKKKKSSISDKKESINELLSLSWNPPVSTPSLPYGYPPQVQLEEEKKKKKKKDKSEEHGEDNPDDELKLKKKKKKKDKEKNSNQLLI